MSLSLNRPYEDQEAAADGRAGQRKGEVYSAQLARVRLMAQSMGPVLFSSVERAALTALLAERDALVKAATVMVEAHNNWLWGTDEAERVDEAVDHLRTLLAPERQVGDE